MQFRLPTNIFRRPCASLAPLPSMKGKAPAAVNVSHGKGSWAHDIPLRPPCIGPLTSSDFAKGTVRTSTVRGESMGDPMRPNTHNDNLDEHTVRHYEREPGRRRRSPWAARRESRCETKFGRRRQPGTLPEHERGPSTDVKLTNIG